MKSLKQQFFNEHLLRLFIVKSGLTQSLIKYGETLLSFKKLRGGLLLILSEVLITTDEINTVKNWVVKAGTISFLRSLKPEICPSLERL
jgi:hypothetical protein